MYECNVDNGRFVIKSQKTGKTYLVEAIGDPHTEWGSIDQATGKLMNKKSWKKHRGSIDEHQSVIKSENGFTNIGYLEPGMSPLEYIKKLEA